MPVRTDTLKERLSHSSEITITVTGRKSGRKISNPIWFVFEGDTLFLLPVKGSDTQWYLNVVKNPQIQIEAGGTEMKGIASAITDAKQVAPVVERFRKKYGPGDVKKYYSKFDVAVTVQMA